MNSLSETKGQKIFGVFNVLFLVVLMVITLYPIFYVLIASVSDAGELMKHEGILLAPQGFQLSSYKMVFKDQMILRGYLNTLIVVVGGVIVNMAITALGAYGLSRENVFWNKYISLMVIFTMFFGGGLVPRFLAVKSLGLNNTYLALILPVAVNTYNLILMRTGFSSVPKSLEEAATLDGAGHVRIMFSVVLPLSKAILAVMALYYTVAHWNSWFDAMIFLKDRKMYPLQLILREILIQNSTAAMTHGSDMGDAYSISESLKYAVIVVSTLPILCVYPFLQKYFVKGVMIGAVKG